MPSAENTNSDTPLLVLPLPWIVTLKSSGGWRFLVDRRDPQNPDLFSGFKIDNHGSIGRGPSLTTGGGGRLNLHRSHFCEHLPLTGFACPSCRPVMMQPTKRAKASPLGMFLREAARYFEERPTNGEDGTHWANVYNADNCRRAADFIDKFWDEAYARESD
jgi:hypothetical protein